MMWCTVVSEGPQLGLHDAEGRQSPGQLYVWSLFFFQSATINYRVFYRFFFMSAQDEISCFVEALGKFIFCFFFQIKQNI